MSNAGVFLFFFGNGPTSRQIRRLFRSKDEFIDMPSHFTRSLLIFSHFSISLKRTSFTATSSRCVAVRSTERKLTLLTRKIRPKTLVINHNFESHNWKSLCYWGREMMSTCFGVSCWKLSQCSYWWISFVFHPPLIGLGLRKTAEQSNRIKLSRGYDLESRIGNHCLFNREMSLFLPSIRWIGSDWMTMLDRSDVDHIPTQFLLSLWQRTLLQKFISE